MENVSKHYIKESNLKKLLTVAHSPDADDIFMYFASNFGWIDDANILFRNIALDIETLNIEAMKGSYPVSAISFGMYPLIHQEYALLNTAMSFGEGYGPKLIKKKSTPLKRNFKVALSGQYTTNAMLFRIAYPDAKIIYKNFLDIEQSVLNGEVDAGVLIHESILDFDDSLECIDDIWNMWTHLIGDEIPLPLGGMAIKRSMPLLRAIKVQELLIKSIEVAISNQTLLSKMLHERNLLRIKDDLLTKYLNMYANKNSIIVNDIQIQSLQKLYDLGYKNKFYANPIDVSNMFLPTKYKELYS